jgi:hypothetical protein
MLWKTGAQYIVHRNPSLVPDLSHRNAVYLHIQYGVLRIVFYLRKSVVSRLASGSLLAQPSAKFVIIFYRQENELCRTKMTLSERNTKGKKYKIT